MYKHVGSAINVKTYYCNDIEFKIQPLTLIYVDTINMIVSQTR